MASYTDSLRGYGSKIFECDNYICQYCGVDGRTSFEVWLTLSVDHLLPVGHVNRETDDFKVTACQFCNTADNLYFKKYTIDFDNLTPNQLVQLRREKVLDVRVKYQQFWVEKVKLNSK